MKYLLLFVVIGVAFWMFKARHRVPGPKKPPPAPRPDRQAAAPMPMLACAHCGVHLPQGDAAIDASGRPYCSAAHLQAGPR